jgi:hypothetical protein
MYGFTALCLTLAAFSVSPISGRKAATYTQPSMPRVGFEPTIPVFKRGKTVHVLYHAATVIGFQLSVSTQSVGRGEDESRDTYATDT